MSILPSMLLKTSFTGGKSTAVRVAAFACFCARGGKISLEAQFLTDKMSSFVLSRGCIVHVVVRLQVRCQFGSCWIHSPIFKGFKAIWVQGRTRRPTGALQPFSQTLQWGPKATQLSTTSTAIIQGCSMFCSISSNVGCRSCLCLGLCSGFHWSNLWARRHTPCCPCPCRRRRCRRCRCWCRGWSCPSCCWSACRPCCVASSCFLPQQFLATTVVGLDVQLCTALAPGVKELASLDLHWSCPAWSSRSSRRRRRSGPIPAALVGHVLEGLPRSSSLHGHRGSTSVRTSCKSPKCWTDASPCPRCRGSASEAATRDWAIDPALQVVRESSSQILQSRVTTLFSMTESMMWHHQNHSTATSASWMSRVLSSMSMRVMFGIGLMCGYRGCCTFSLRLFWIIIITIPTAATLAPGYSTAYQTYRRTAVGDLGHGCWDDDGLFHLLRLFVVVLVIVT